MYFNPHIISQIPIINFWRVFILFCVMDQSEAAQLFQHIQTQASSMFWEREPLFLDLVNISGEKTKSITTPYRDMCGNRIKEVEKIKQFLRFCKLIYMYILYILKDSGIMWTQGQYCKAKPVSPVFSFLHSISNSCSLLTFNFEVQKPI